MYRSLAPSNDSGAAAGCCASSRRRGGSLRWSGGTCGPCPGRGSSFLQRSGRASPGACAPPLWSIGCRGCVWRPCGRGRSGSPRRTCRWSPRPPSRSWALGGLRSDAQHAPANTRSIQWVYHQTGLDLVVELVDCSADRSTELQTEAPWKCKTRVPLQFMSNVTSWRCRCQLQMFAKVASI